MTGETGTKTVGELPSASGTTSLVPAVLTRVVWGLWLLSLVAVAARLTGGGRWEVPGVFAVDGLTLLMWSVVTFFAGVVLSYSRRYLAGDRHETRFFVRVGAFTLAVLVLVAADHLLLFLGAWVAMGLVMAGLVGHVADWEQAQAARRLARNYFLAGGASLAVALGTLWATTGATTVSEVAAAAAGASGGVWSLVGLTLLLAAMVQSALAPFHTWLLSSMTAPTPASALMHAGFVNAGGILLTRFAPVVTVDPSVLLLVVLVGAASALLGKFLKSVAADVKRQLGCSTMGQMGFMMLQAGLGFFGAAITHLVLHGFYKAYLFLAAGERVERTAPAARGEPARTGPVGWLVTGLAALAGGAIFVLLTGKGTSLDGGLLLTLLVVLTTLHATRDLVRRTSLPARLRYGAVPLVFLPAVALYAGVYVGVTGLLSDLPVVTAPVVLTPLHWLVVGAFVLAYALAETGVYRRSTRLYVALLNLGQPAPGTLAAGTEVADD
ncbi:oxidoreductase [Salinirubellus salinus]|uniref:Oxidoreductase n=1 Tax=Salinirubellus salinus TaxID=1364945 RepID=A0A9E7U779_9EURY|nr:proton-conducting transporter membrane subunit [Salinirubellus salinus]UWM53296.1 oxidoreductase [Salinirubellus salinus]